MNKIFSGLMMKRIIIVAAIALTGLFVSCDDSGDDPAVNPVPANQAGGLYFYDADPQSDEIGGNVYILKAADDSAITHYLLYWGSDSTTKIGSPIAEIEKTGKNTILYNITENTIMQGSHLLVFAKTGQGEESTCASHSLEDRPFTIDGDFEYAYSVYAADVDGDGDLDVLAAASSGNNITWWENNGIPGNIGWTEHTIDANFGGAYSVYAADVDGDGNLDVLGASSWDDEIAWWENDGSPGNGGWIKHTIDANFNDAYSVYAADIDGDGDLDVLGAARIGNDITWWENNGIPGNIGWIEHTIDGDFEYAYSVYAADVDGDGDLDVLGASCNDDRITWWENDGNPGNIGWTEHTIVGDFKYAASVYAADVDGDGDLDVLGGSKEGNISWWENDGSPGNGGWIKHTITDVLYNVNSVYAVDMDGDGDLDVLGAALKNVGTITWWENDGNPENVGWTEHVITANFNGANSVYAADVDGDGNQDILGAAYVDGITWWKIFY